AIGVIVQRYRTATGQVVLRDYNFNKPQLDLTATASADKDTDLEVYDYPGAYAELKDGKRLAQVRLEALQAERAVMEIHAACPRLCPGKYLEIVDAPYHHDGEYFITSTIHELRGGVFKTYATVIPRKTKFRTPQVTPRPIIDGPQTAMIVAPPGSP